MTATKVIGLLSIVFLVGFFAFGFRQAVHGRRHRRD
jgi:hypothetical protein